jgi:hypothetical protein
MIAELGPFLFVLGLIGWAFLMGWKLGAESVDRSPEGGNRETGCHAKHESAVGSEANETPRGSRSSTSQEGSN